MGQRHARATLWARFATILATIFGAAGCGEEAGSSCADGVRNGAEAGVDCGPGCAACQGDSCSGDTACETGHCADGVCCESACDDLCMACSTEAKGSGEDGICGAVAAGADPRGDCEDDGAATCGEDGTCDGAGACRRYAAGTVCGGATSCTGATQTDPGTCDASGACQPGATTECAPYACGATQCKTACSTEADCTAGHYCGPGSACLPQQDLGAACEADVACSSGLCVDGVCCNYVCDLPCTACSAAKKGSGLDGECGLIAAGSDPDDECADEGAASCGQDGTCDGMFGCSYYPIGTPCGADGSCTNGVETDPDTCAGPSLCMAGATSACGAYICDFTACRTSCAQQGECVTGAYCSVGSECLPKRGAGSICLGDEVCLSNHCVFALPGTEICSCNGTDAACSPLQYCFSPFCAPKKANGSTCTANNECLSDRCVGTPLVCDVCLDSTGCVPGYYCSAGACVVRLQGGATCTSPDECMTGSCTAGVCDSCSASVLCPATHYCNGSGACQLKLALGFNCTDNVECASGNCNLDVGRCN